MSIIHGAGSGRFDDDHEPPSVRSTPWRAYGLSDEDFGAMYRDQGGRCAICEDETRLNVDHDHETGKVRGLLCRRCNVALGFLRDDPELADLAAAYLRRA